MNSYMSIDEPSSTEDQHDHHEVEGPGYPTPAAMRTESEREQTAFVMAPRVGMDVDASDFVGVIDVDPESETYCEIIDTVDMPNKGDELHHFGWNTCSSSCHTEGLNRDHLIVPGQRSSRIHILDAADPRNPQIEQVIEPEELFEYDLSAPHTVHCVPEGKIVISMLGNADAIFRVDFFNSTRKISRLTVIGRQTAATWKCSTTTGISLATA
jgi:selenium-binding protein 1